MPIPKLGQLAPGFQLLSDSGEKVRLSEFRGRRVVLYFYPHADTPGCSKEAGGFRDAYSAYQDREAIVVGVSPDTVKAQAKFKTKHGLPFVLLADPDHKVASLYGVWGMKKMMGREFLGIRRTTFLIDEKGRIRRVFERVKPEGHSAEVLAAL